MKVSPEELKHRLNQFKESAKQSGIKLTHQRIEIFKEIAKSTTHPNVATIYKGVRKRIPSVSLDTVYRTLWTFLDLRLITTLGPNREKPRFDANMKPHHHFECIKCSKTYDFYSKEFDQIIIPDSVITMGNVNKVQVVAKGLCFQCSKIKEKT